MFATGIENSIPTINNGKTRVDEMEKCGHYEHWRTDFDCVQEIGINYLRYGPPIHTTYLGPGKYDWEFSDLTFAELRRRDIIPIVDLCHFGVPGLDRQFPESRLPAAVRPVRRGVRRALPVGSALHAGQRDVHLRDLLGHVRLVERAADDATRPSSRR